MSDETSRTDSADVMDIELPEAGGTASDAATPVPATPVSATPVPATQIPAQSRVQSDEELLSQEEPRARTALARLGSLGRTGRTGRALQAAAVVCALGLIAAVSGTLTHGTDVHSAAANSDRRVLVRLVGGGPSLALVQDDTRTTGTLSVGVQMQMTIRNDGSRPIQVVTADVQQAGVVLDDPVSASTVRPGQSQAVGLRLTVACNRVDLPEYPDAVTLGLRDPDGRVTSQTFAFDPGHPAKSAQTQNLGNVVQVDPSQGTLLDALSLGSSYFQMCSEGFQENGTLDSTFQGMIGTATPADPTISYKVRVESGDQWSRILSVAPDTRTLASLGLSTATDLAAPVRIDPGAPREVTVSDRVTDCATVSKAITGLGLANYLEEAGTAAGLATKAADPRFQQAGEWPVGFFRDSASPETPASTFSMAFILQLAAACPGLK